jgi:DivIVA domain-containing protein
MLTPQAIKDQEFQVKFRGYDAIEVKAYLELLAEDFFELNEQNRVQTEEIETLQAEREALEREKESLAGEVKLSRENADGIQSEIEKNYKHKDQEIDDLRKQLAAAHAMITSLESDNRRQSEKITELEVKLAGGQGATIQEHAENEKLRAKIASLEEQNHELKQQGLDFKTTILAAQKFADNLRQTSEVEAQQLMTQARAEVENFRNEANVELARLPKEIEALNQKKTKVRDELRAMLHSYLEALDVFSTADAPAKEDDLSDLFESIRIPDGESVDPDDIESINMDLV